MVNNYLYLLRAVNELNGLLQNTKTIECFTQEKDKLFLHFLLNDYPNFHLILNTDQTSPFVNYRSEFHKAKRNVKLFYSDYFPDTLKDISIAQKDRIIKFSFCKTSLYLVIRGKSSNLLLEVANNFLFFKKMPENESEKIIADIKCQTYIKNEDPILNELRQSDENKIISNYRFIDKSILTEIENRSDDNRKILHVIVNEILHENIEVISDNSVKTIFFQPFNFGKFVQSYTSKVFDNYFLAVNYYNTIKKTILKSSDLKRIIEKHLFKEIEKVTNRINNLKSRIDNGSNELKYFNDANLLLANISKIKKGMKLITLKNDCNEMITIQLEERLTPNKNVDALFDKSRSEKINFYKTQDLYRASQKEYERLQNIYNRFCNLKDDKDFYLIQKELKMREKPLNDKNDEKGFNFRRYLIDGKYELFVGKDSRNNDQLTTRFAKQNDFWFHARSVSGSHVVLRVINTKEPIPKNILKKAASIAAFYSKAKTSKLVPVSYSYKKYVVKRKDLDPGQVIMLREEVLLVPPEIPTGCVIQPTFE